jgi:type II secretory pathway component PulF
MNYANNTEKQKLNVETKIPSFTHGIVLFESFVRFWTLSLVLVFATCILFSLVYISRWDDGQ